MKSLTAILLLTVSVALRGHAQIEATTADGKIIILNNDSTWRYKKVVKRDAVKVDFDCKNYIETKTDKVSGRTGTYSTKPVMITKDQKNGLAIQMLARKTGGFAVSIVTVQSGVCIDEGSLTNILFRDGSRIELKNESSFNCDAGTSYWFGGPDGKEEEAKILQSVEIDIIRIRTTKGRIEETLTPQQSRQLMRTVYCMNNL